ncbi:MAG: SET domain-containing protein-lysine N-methyltransferase [Promethearchaeota archaeon]
MNNNSEVRTCSYGKCLVATNKLEIGTCVEKFEGLIVPWEEISYEEVCYVIWISFQQWMVIKTDARYINHSCDPNCIIDNDLNVMTTRPVTQGEELTISYNTVRNDENPGEWDQRWSFPCKCGSRKCIGVIDKYMREDGTMWTPTFDLKSLDD